MSGQSANSRRTAALYTPDLLALAVSLAGKPFDPGMPLVGEARSRTCGSTVRFSARFDETHGLADTGAQVSACAVGQAAAAIFLGQASGKSGADIAHARQSIAVWLADGGPLPDWPGLVTLEAARAFPGRHNAILLAWDAALAALANGESRG
jgi:NifU-like protein involved in Fe-S cluster formation